MTEDWLAEAMRMPVAFAQVREDPRVDLDVVERLGGRHLHGLMIASGGCTAAMLVASGRFATLQLVDANAAQLALAHMKIDALQNLPPAERMSQFGYAEEAALAEDLAADIESQGLPPDVFGPPAVVAALGPDHAGRYELLFAELRRAMGKLAAEWPAILTAPNAAAAVEPGTPRGRLFDDAFDRVMALPNLVALFGDAATQNAVEPFARHFARRTRHALATLPTADNSFLWQLLVGRFPPGVAYDWLAAPPPPRHTRLTFTHAPMADALAEFDGAFDFVHLSNILDWLSPDEAAGALRLAHRALRPGGLTIIRQLNSTLDLPSLAPQIEWLTAEADALHATDRSFFYRRLHLGRRS